MPLPLELSGPAVSHTGVLPRSLAFLPDGRLLAMSFVYRNDHPDPMVYGGQDMYAGLFADLASASGAGTRIASTGWDEPTPRWYRPFRDAVATPMADGKVFLAWRLEDNIYWGISVNSPGQNPTLYSAIYDPATGTVSGLGLFPTLIDSNIDMFGGHVGQLHDLATLSDGKLVLVNTGLSAPGSPQDIKLTVMDAHGTILATTIANEVTAGYQVDPAVTVLPDGFLLTWTDGSASANHYQGSVVRARLFDNAGRAVTADILVDASGIGSHAAPASAALPGGGFVVTWQRWMQPDGVSFGTTGVFMQRFAADGSKVGLPTQMPASASGEQSNPAVHAFSDGSVLVAWADQRSVKAQYFDAAGQAVGAELHVGTWHLYGPRIAIDEAPDGRVLVTWGSELGAAGGARFLDSPTLLTWGTAGGDVLFGPEAPSRVHDVLVAFAGDDELWGYAGRDYLYAGEGADTLVGGTDADILLGEGGDDALLGGDGNDHLFGGAGANDMLGDGGDDVLISQGSQDTLQGGDGADWLYAYGTGLTYAYGDAGGDIFVMQSGRGHAIGGEGNDWFYMGAGADVMEGGAGVDVLVGGGGGDWFDGGSGTDYLFLGEGHDTVRVRAGTGVDVVNGFDVRQDILDLAGTGFGSLEEVIAASTDFDGFSIVRLSDDTVVWLVGLSAHSLGRDNLSFA